MSCPFSDERRATHAMRSSWSFRSTGHGRGESASITRGLRTISALSKSCPNCFSARIRLPSETKKHRRANGSALRAWAATSPEGHQSGKLECVKIAKRHPLAMHNSAISIGGMPYALDMTTRAGEALPNERSMSITICALPNMYRRARVMTDGLIGRRPNVHAGPRQFTYPSIQLRPPLDARCDRNTLLERAGQPFASTIPLILPREFETCSK